MRKIILSLFTLLILSNLKAQTVLYENFNAYDGTSTTVPSGWFFSYNGNYTSAASSGPSTPNSYKFGVDGAYIISPMVMSGDSVSFYMRLNGSGTPANDTLSSISVLGSLTDTAASSFTTIGSYVKIGSTMKRYSLAKGNNMYIKIIYDKVGGNIAFDDFAIYSGTFVSIINPTPKNLNFEVYPNPSSNGYFNIKAEGSISNAQLAVYDILGKEVLKRPLDLPGKFLLDLTDMPKGLYLLNIKSDNKNDVRKIKIE
jgi:hypothetical protein